MGDPLDELISDLVRHPHDALKCAREGDTIVIEFHEGTYVTTADIAAGIADILRDEIRDDEDPLAQWLRAAAKAIAAASGEIVH